MGLEAKWLSKRQNKEHTCPEGQTAVEPLCVELHQSSRPVQVRTNKGQEGRQ